jgi:hypothetical protein
MTNPLLILASPAFPNVPDLPGVPPIARKLGTEAVAAIGLLDPSLEASIFGGQQPEQWGIADSHYNFVLQPDSVVRMDVDEPYRVSDYPVEQGLFASYNKVKIPKSGTVTMAKGGSTSERQAFLHAAEAVEKSLEQYTILVPEGFYGPVTIDRVSYERRASNGATLILVHLHFTEIRITPPVQIGKPGSQQPKSQVPASARTSAATSTGLPDPTQTSSPTSQAMVNSGVVGASAPSGVVNAALNAAVPVGNW